MRYKLNIQNFVDNVPEPGASLVVNVNGNDYIIGGVGSATWNNSTAMSLNSDKYTISNGKVVWNDGTILQYNGVDVLPTDDIIADGVYTTRAATPTTGTVKFGTSAPTKYYLGNKAVDRIYMGTTLLYKKAIVYTITANLANCTANSDNPITIEENGGAILYYTANTGYELPDGVELTNVGSYNWDKTTGKLVIARPSGNVTIKIVAKQTMTQLATPQNVSVENTTLSFDEVENAEEYEVFVDNVSIGSYQGAKTFTLPTALELGGGTNPITADGFDVLQGDIKVSSSVYQALTNLNNGGSLTNFGNTCGLTISSSQLKMFKMGVRLKATEDISPDENGKYPITITIPSFSNPSWANIHSLEFDYTNNTAVYTVIEAENIDPELHAITFTAEKIDGSTLVLFDYSI